MVPFAYRAFRQSARQTLTAAQKPHGLTALHTGITVSFGLAITALQFALQRGIAGTGGLGGIDRRTFLEFLESLLFWANVILLPFWCMGFLSTALGISRRQTVSRCSLLDGFRHWGTVLRTSIWRGFVCFLALFFGGQLGSTLFLVTPAAQKLLQLTQELTDSGITDSAALMAHPDFQAAALPMLPWVAVCALALAIPIFYRTRFMSHVAMDQPERGGFYALIRSVQMTRRRFWALVVLDLRFFWYYVPMALALALSLAPGLLPMLGVELPMGRGEALFTFAAASAVLRLALAAWLKPDVAVTYCLIFDHIKENPVPVAPKVPRTPVPGKPPKPQSVPWNY